MNRGTLLTQLFSLRRSRFLSSSTDIRPFPNYSPKKPSVKDTELIQQITNVIKLRRDEPLPQTLKQYQSKFKTDHLIWILIKIKSDYKLVLNFFNWARTRKDTTLESLCIVTHIAVSANDVESARLLITSYYQQRRRNSNHTNTQLFDVLIYTYKDWSSTPNVFDVFFKVLIEFNLLNEAKRVFEKILNYGLVLSIDSCNLYLDRLSKEYNRSVNALIVFKEFPEFGVCWNVASYNIVIRFLCDLGRVREAHHLLLLMEMKGYEADVVSYSTVINGYEEIDKVRKLIKEMKRKGLTPNSYTYSSVISLLCRKCNLTEAEEAFNEMIRDGIVPDNVVYTNLIDGYCKRGDVRSALLFFKGMQSPDVVMYTAMISGFCKINDMVEAVKLFDEMCCKGLKPDEIVFTEVINGYCKSGKVKEAFTVYNRMNKSGCVPNVVTYSSLIDGLCKEGDIDSANDLLHEMLRLGFKPNVITYNSIVNGLCKGGEIEEAVNLIGEYDSVGVNADVFTYTTLMNGYCKRGEMVKAQEILKEMLRKGIEPSIVTFYVLMNGFCCNGMLEDGEKLLNWMLARGMTVNANMYNPLVKQYCIRNDMKSANNVYKRMCCSSDGYTYENLMRGHCKARNMKEAWFLYREMNEKGFKVSVGTYSVLVKGFLKRKKFVEAREVFDQMKREGLVEDREILDFFSDVNCKGRRADTNIDPVDEIIEDYLCG